MHSDFVLRRPMTGILRYGAYPGLLIGNGCIAAYAVSAALPLPAVSFGAVIGSFAYLALLERIIPYQSAWHPTAREWARDGIYFAIIAVTSMVAGAFLNALAIYLAPDESGLPLALEVPLALLLSTFTGYWFHRCAHVHRWLWKVHGVHHTPEKVNLANNSVMHFIDVFVPAVITHLPLLLIGISETAVFLVSVFIAAQGYGAHSNIDVRLGWLNYIISGPEQHRLHHSVKIEEAGHYGTDLSVWDLLFGSFTWRPNKKPVKVGVIDPKQFPSPNAILASILFPFRRSYHG